MDQPSVSCKQCGSRDLRRAALELTDVFQLLWLKYPARCSDAELANT